jgi:steroid delta-isomerase-like uncharacterized protein
MTTEQNKIIIRRLFDEVVNQANLALLDELVSDDIVTHTAVPGVAPNREGFRQFVGIYLNAFPVQHTEIHSMIAEGDLVAVNHTHHVTHGGDFMGAPASGKEAVAPGIEIYRIAGGRIVEMWHQDDLFSLMLQLGLLLVPGQ